MEPAAVTSPEQQAPEISKKTKLTLTLETLGVIVAIMFSGAVIYIGLVSRVNAVEASNTALKVQVEADMLGLRNELKTVKDTVTAAKNIVDTTAAAAAVLKAQIEAEAKARVEAEERQQELQRRIDTLLTALAKK